MIEQYIGIDSDIIIIALAAISFIVLIIMLINVIQMKKLKKRLDVFMEGKNAKSLEDNLIYRLEQMDELMIANATNERNIDTIFKKMKMDFKKYGLIKYDAFQEMGGKLSFTLAMLNEKNDGFVINAVHSRDGCYTYVKEIIDSNAIIPLAAEEEEALKRALEEYDA